MTERDHSGAPKARDAAARVSPVITWRDFWIGSACALATVAIWAAWPVVTRHGVVGALDPMAIAVLRFLPPVVILAPIWWRVGLLPPMRPVVMAGLLCGGLPFFIGAAEGFRFASVANAVTVSSGLIPLVVAGLSVLLFRARIERIRIAGFAFIVAAIVLTVAQGLMQTGSQIWLGQMLFAASGVAFALYSIAFPFSGLSGMQATAVVAVWSLIVTLPFGAAGIAGAVQQGLWGEIALQLFQQGVLSAMVSFLTYNAAVARIGPGRAATVLALAPVLASAVAYVVLGEAPTWPLAVALILTTIGVALASRVAPRKS